MITVVNKKTHEPGPDDVYIGRPSKWGNPFTHIWSRTTRADYIVSTREEAIENYEAWIQTNPYLMSSLHELKDKTLVCWCKPYACHGDVLKRLVEGS